MPLVKVYWLAFGADTPLVEAKYQSCSEGVLLPQSVEMPHVLVSRCRRRWVGETVPLKAGPQNLSRAGFLLDEAPGVGDAR